MSRSNVKLWAVILAAFILVTLTPPPSLPLSPPSAGAQELEPTLSLVAVPPNIPADGRKHSSIVVQLTDERGPVLAPHDIRVLLTSSNLTVGRVENVTIRKGESFAVAVFASSRQAGSTTISALSEGLRPASLEVTTVTPAGTPTKLGLYPLPARLPAKEGLASRLLVRLEDERGLPQKAAEDISVTLVSSNPEVGRVGRTLVIPEGRSSAMALFLAAGRPGETRIEASAPGFEATSVTITATGRKPSKLGLFLLPSKVNLRDDVAWVMAQLQDSDGKPIEAEADIVVTLFSSNSKVAVAVEPLLVKKGESFGLARLRLGGSTGSSEISAIAENFPLIKATLTVVSGSATPSRVGMALPPISLPADGKQYRVLVFQLLDSNGNPTVTSKLIPISLSVQDPELVSVSPAAIPGGKSYVLVEVETSTKSGSTDIRAFAPGFQAVSGTVTVIGEKPSKLVLLKPDGLIPAAKGRLTALAVQLLDGNGDPTVAKNPITVSLSSSNPEVGKTDETVTITRGESHAFFNFYATDTAGKTTISGLAEGFTVGPLEVSTSRKPPIRLALYAAPATIHAKNATYRALYVELQDENGRPALSELPVTVSLVSSNPRLVEPPAEVQIQAGSTFARVPVRVGWEEGSVAVSASSPGLQTASVKLSTFLLPLTLGLALTDGGQPIDSLRLGSPYRLQVRAVSDRFSTAGVTVILSASPGTLSEMLLAVDEAGLAETTYTPSKGGPGNITASAAPLGFTPADALLEFTVEPLATQLAEEATPEEEPGTTAPDEEETAMEVQPAENQTALKPQPEPEAEGSENLMLRIFNTIITNPLVVLAVIGAAGGIAAMKLLRVGRLEFIHIVRHWGRRRYRGELEEGEE